MSTMRTAFPSAIIYLFRSSIAASYLRAVTLLCCRCSPFIARSTVLVTLVAFPTTFAKYLTLTFTIWSSAPCELLSGYSQVTVNPVFFFSIVIVPSGVSLNSSFSSVVSGETYFFPSMNNLNDLSSDTFIFAWLSHSASSPLLKVSVKTT